ncbi:MAG: hypothetical protein HQK99_05815 [Nitrospirae bacterium]|nr:hypothetical protein [Nitrospirota bacterium]
MIKKALERWVDKPARDSGIQPGGSDSRVTQYEEKIPVLILFFEDLLNIEETLTRERPAVVVLDMKGYFQGELEKFRNGCAQLFAQAVYFKVLAIGNTVRKESSVIKDVVSDWCMDTPIDPVLIVSKVRMLLASGAKSGSNGNNQSDTDVLMSNLMGFLNIK